MKKTYTRDFGNGFKVTLTFEFRAGRLKPNAVFHGTPQLSALAEFTAWARESANDFARACGVPPEILKSFCP